MLYMEKNRLRIKIEKDKQCLRNHMPCVKHQMLTNVIWVDLYKSQLEARVTMNNHPN